MSSTESQNPQSQNLDQLSSLEYVDLHVKEEQAVMKALKNASKEIAQAIDLIYESFEIYQETESKNLPEKLPDARLATKEMAELTEPSMMTSLEERNAADGTLQVDSNYKGPRLFYIGAGTSGRLGVLDASECPPTFSTDPLMVQGIIAGGDTALRNAVEGAEDDKDAGIETIKQCSIKSTDIVIGISASGSAPYVLGALEVANELGAKTIAIANNIDAASFKVAKHKIFLDTGPEILAGSTRLKAGTSQKICLNMLSTGLMVKLGKTYGNLMVDLRATNSKLKKRAVNLVMTILGCDEAKAIQLLEENEYKVKKIIGQKDSITK